MDPRALVCPLAVLVGVVLSSSKSCGFEVRAALANVFSEYRVMVFSELVPGSLVFQLQYISTATTSPRATPVRTPPKIQRRLLSKMRPRRVGWNARMVANR